MKKIGTVLDEELIMPVKDLVAQEGKPLAELIEETLVEYLRRWQTQGVAARTAAALPAPTDVVRAILSEEEDVFAV